MFHRVLPEKEAEELGADPLWTITPEILSDAIAFCGRHYNIVSLGQVRRHSHGGAVLPPRALLITFDDGWRDNHRYALPVLRADSCPAVLFLAADHVGHDEPFWEEQVFAAWKTGVLKTDSVEWWLDDLGAGSDRRPLDEEKQARLLIRRLQQDMPEDIDGQLEHYAGKRLEAPPGKCYPKRRSSNFGATGWPWGRTDLPTDLSRCSMKNSLRMNSQTCKKPGLRFARWRREALRHFVSPRLVFEKGDRTGAQRRFRVDVFQRFHHKRLG